MVSFLHQDSIKNFGSFQEVVTEIHKPIHTLYCSSVLTFSKYFLVRMRSRFLAKLAFFGAHYALSQYIKKLKIFF